ncbi:MAG: DUF4062 domain-containing protein [Planctomycetes bacterium]|nr:DUF4062 domain-containing protein [Planctomycetota bacterium]
MKIYVSATFRDLEKHRLAVLNILRRMGHQPLGMEDYVAEGIRPLSRCLEDVASCDAFLCIVAWRYGYVPQDGVLPALIPPGVEFGKTSITECEYRKAQQAGKPILAFVLSSNAQWPSHCFDAVTGESEAGSRIAQFRQELSQQHLINHFESAEELAGLVSAAIYRTEMSRHMGIETLNTKATFNEPFKRNGWVSDSTLYEIELIISGPEKIQALQVNIGAGTDWWMNRLYFLCSLAADLTPIELVVFEANFVSPGDNHTRRFIGMVHPRIVKDRLASQYDFLNQYEIKVSEAPSAADLSDEVRRRAFLWSVIVETVETEPRRPIFVTERNLEHWLEPHLMGQSIDLEPTINAALRIQRVLDWPTRFVPITENGQLKQVVDKVALTEQVARLFIREQVSRALSTVR